MRLTVTAAVSALVLPIAVTAVSGPSAASPPSSGAGAASATAKASAKAPCDPWTTPVYRGKVPTPKKVIGFDLGDQEVRNRQSDRYVRKVAEASPRVRTGVLATTAQGRPVVYAIVGSPKDVKAAQRASRILRNPHTSERRAAQVAAHAPAIAWDAANVHGNEESGADAALRLLWDLADRSDCAAKQIRDNVVTVIVPIQNPDGRFINYRRNSYGFDMNRDWFARTQPETDGKVELLRKFPSVLFIDDHEMGSEGFFFPPNADPIHHEVADRSINWVNNLYGAAMIDEFTDRDLSFFNYDIYDMFYMGYGDSVPMTGFLGAGMTFEKDNADPIGVRLRQQFIAVWTSFTALATHKKSVLTGWAASHRQAYREGVRGKLERNAVFEPGSTLRQQVPKQKVRNYFLVPTQGKAADVQDLVRRLQRMDVQVRTLTAPLKVRDYHAYGTKGSRPTTLPRGTFWISMAQGQKHWIQAMLGEDSFVPFPYFYDVTAWSGPLLANVEGGRSGAKVRPASVKTPQLKASQPPGDGPRSPSVGIWYFDPVSTSAYENEGAMRWLYDDKWKLPYRSIQSARIDRRELAGLDVLIAPGGYAPAAYHLLGPRGRAALKHWVANGGRLVTMAGGTELAARMELTSARLRSPSSDIPGSLLRTVVEPGPLARGVGNSVWTFFNYDNVMKARPESVAVRYPAFHSKQWSLSGFARGAKELAKTAAVVDERYGAGRVVSFAADPNFRGYTSGTQKLLWNAVYGPNPSGKATVPGIAKLRAAAARAAAELRHYTNQMVVTVRAEAQSKAEQVLSGYRAPAKATVLPGGIVQYRIRMASAEESSFARSLLSDLAGLGDDVLAVRLP